MQLQVDRPSVQLAGAHRPAKPLPSSAPARAAALIVHDDAQTLATLEFALETEGLTVATARSAAAALLALDELRPDLVVLDRTDATVGTADLHEQIRRRDIPVIALSNGPDDDVAPGSGGDSAQTAWLPTPFHPRVLVALARDLTSPGRRTRADTVLHVGQLQIDLVRHAVTLAGRRLQLSHTDFKLLAHLAAHRGTPQTWRELHHAIWGTEPLLGGRDVVKSAIYRVRGRLARSGGHPDYIRTLHGTGYLMPDLAPLP